MRTIDNVKVPDALAAELDRVATEKGKPVAHVVRELLEEHVRCLDAVQPVQGLSFGPTEVRTVLDVVELGVDVVKRANPAPSAYALISAAQVASHGLPWDAPYAPEGVSVTVLDEGRVLATGVISRTAPIPPGLAALADIFEATDRVWQAALREEPAMRASRSLAGRTKRIPLIRRKTK